MFDSFGQLEEENIIFVFSIIKNIHKKIKIKRKPHKFTKFYEGLYVPTMHNALVIKFQAHRTIICYSVSIDELQSMGWVAKFQH